MPIPIAASSEQPDRTTRFGLAALVAMCSTVLVAVAFLIWSSMTTASARFAASTSNENSLLTAASVDIVVGGAGGSSAALRIEGDGLYPGRIVERCLPVTFRGTIDGVSVRLMGRLEGGTGLGQFIATEIDRGTGSDENCQDFVADIPVYRGPLDQLWLDHPTFAEGLRLLPAAVDGETTTMRVRLEVESDNDAQGRTTDFSLIVEGRP